MTIFITQLHGQPHTVFGGTWEYEGERAKKQNKTKAVFKGVGVFLGKGSLHKSMKRKSSDNVVHREVGLSSGNPMYLGKGSLHRSMKRKYHQTTWSTTWSTGNYINV